MQETMEFVPTITEQVRILLDGRPQKWLVNEFKKLDDVAGESYFGTYNSVRLSGRMNNTTKWTIQDLKGLGQIFETTLRV